MIIAGTLFWSTPPRDLSKIDCAYYYLRLAQILKPVTKADKDLGIRDNKVQSYKKIEDQTNKRSWKKQKYKENERL